MPASQSAHSQTEPNPHEAAHSLHAAPRSDACDASNNVNQPLCVIVNCSKVQGDNVEKQNLQNDVDEHSCSKQNAIDDDGKIIWHVSYHCERYFRASP